MNTWELKKITDFKDLSDWEKTIIIDDLKSVDETVYSFASIQLEASLYQDGTTLYGVYFMTSEEVCNYNSNGGLWEYLPITYYKQLLGVDNE